MTIKVNEKTIAQDYHNYMINYNSPSHFIRELAKSKEEKYIKDFGYEVKIEPYNKKLTNK